jgi:hypothetical protein
MLVRCLYASRAAPSVATDVLDSILQQSRRNNPRLGITGLLCFAGGTFIQVIEGGRDQVCDLLNAIIRDDRHTNVRILTYEEISERHFGNWTMGEVNIETINPALLLKYSATATLDPFGSSGHATMALLNELAATGAIGTRSG